MTIDETMLLLFDPKRLLVLYNLWNFTQILPDSAISENFDPIVLGRTRMERDRAWERDYMPDRQKIDYYNLIF